MTGILLVFAAGLAAGRFVGGLARFGGAIDRATTATTVLLLFLLGTNVGANDRVFQRLPELGLTAFSLSLCCIGGSAIVAMFVHRVLFRDP